MATNTIYQLSFKDWPIGTDGQINPNHTDIATFSSIEEANAFIEASGSEGIYNVQAFIVKS
jgi:uroporphyrinogen-III synthase